MRLFQADYRDGTTTSEWTFYESKRKAQFQPVMVNGERWGSHEVAKGDQFSTTSGERSEVRTGTLYPPGSERWTRFLVRFPAEFNYVSGTVWNIFSQLHHKPGLGGVVPCEFHVNARNPSNPRLEAYFRGGAPSQPVPAPVVVDLGQFEREKVYRIIFGLRTAVRDGWAQVHVNDTLMLPRTTMGTCYTDDNEGMYYKQGYYRKPDAATTVVQHKGVVIGERYETSYESDRLVTTYNQAALKDLSEKAWTAQLLEPGRTLGWKRYHTYRSTKSASGFPDEVWVRDRVIFMEVKTESGKVSPAQADWIRALSKAQAEVYCARPRHLEEIANVLTSKGRPPPHKTLSLTAELEVILA